LLSLAVAFGAPVDAQQTPPPPPGAYDAAPYLGQVRNEVLFGDIWERPALSKRDRSLITIAVNQAQYATEEIRLHVERGLDNGLTQNEIAELIAHVLVYSGLATIAVAQTMNASSELRSHLGRALDNGVTQEEIAEVITHVAFYAGFPSAMNASRVAAALFETRGLPVPQADFPGAPYLDVLVDNVLFGEPWERPELSPRERSLITMAVVQTLYATDELRSQMERALDNGVTADELAELIAHVTFYSGFPRGVNSSRTAAEVLRARGVPLPRP
jgi:4-carboxymuconolactone decarboxylase